MNILDILRKIGILRYGKSSWKGDASERKQEFIQEGVFNAEKDNLNFSEVSDEKDKPKNI